MQPRDCLALARPPPPLPAPVQFTLATVAPMVRLFRVLLADRPHTRLAVRGCAHQPIRHRQGTDRAARTPVLAATSFLNTQVLLQLQTASGGARTYTGIGDILAKLYRSEGYVACMSAAFGQHKQ